MFSRLPGNPEPNFPALKDIYKDIGNMFTFTFNIILIHIIVIQNDHQTLSVKENTNKNQARDATVYCKSIQ